MSTKRKKLRSELDDCIFKFEDKNEEILEYFEESTGGESTRSRRQNMAVIQVTLQELTTRWELVTNSLYAYTKFREEEEDEDKSDVQEMKTNYKSLRRKYTSSRSKVLEAIDLQAIADKEANSPDLASQISEPREELASL